MTLDMYGALGTIALVGVDLDGSPGVWASILAGILVVLLGSFLIWALVIRKRVGSPPPDRPGHETERFRFKYGAEPPGEA